MTKEKALTTIFVCVPNGVRLSAGCWHVCSMFGFWGTFYEPENVRLLSAGGPREPLCHQHCRAQSYRESGMRSGRRWGRCQIYTKHQTKTQRHH